jgi:hypothetical protein
MPKILTNTEISPLIIPFGLTIALPQIKKATSGNINFKFRADDDKYADQQQVF